MPSIDLNFETNMTRQMSKHKGTFQTTKNNDFTTCPTRVGVVGPFRATEFECVLQALWQSPVHYRERLRIIGRDGSDSPKTRLGR